MNKGLVERYSQSGLVPVTCHGSWIGLCGETDVVTVVIPTYNREHLLLDALDSVHRQTYRPIELILVDDGSTDRSVSAVQEWAASIPKEAGFAFRCLHQQNKGAAAARNLGVISSCGEFIQFLDSDDLLMPDKLEAGVRILKASEADYTYCRAQFIGESGNRLEEFFGLPGVGNDSDIVSYLWQTMCPVFRRATLHLAGPWRENARVGQDWEYGARLELLGFAGQFDPEVRALFRVHGGPTMGTSSQDEASWDSVVQNYAYVVKLAQHLDRFAPTTRQRIVKRLVLSGIQQGARGYWDGLQRCSTTIRRLGLSDGLLPLGLVVMGLLRVRRICRLAEYLAVGRIRRLT